MKEKKFRIVTRVTEKEFETIKRKAKKQVFRYLSLFFRRRSRPPTVRRSARIMGSVASISTSCSTFLNRRKPVMKHEQF